MDAEAAIPHVLASYPTLEAPQRVERAGSAGFSAAAIWRLEAGADCWCLRQWPAEHPTRERLEFIQATLWQASSRGLPFVPAPIKTRDAAGHVLFEGRFWELTPWLPGAPVDRPNRAHLGSALGALARFHRAVAPAPGAGDSKKTSPGIAERSQRLQQLLESRCVALRRAVRPTDWPTLAPRADRLLQLFWPAARPVERLLAETSRLVVPIQAAIRDVRREHVLFVGDDLTGLVDFGAMRLESVAADVARLLGSMAGDDDSAWEAGLAAYERLRPLSAAERRLSTAFDRSAVLLSGLQWLEWIYAEGRTFRDRAAVERRLDEILVRLERLANA